MRVLLVRTRPKNILAKLNTINFEPLELEYLGAVVKELGQEYRIYDGFVEKTNFIAYLDKYQPDVVGITGYSLHVNAMKQYAAQVKVNNPQTLVVVGGVHAELNWEDFFDPSIDIVVHANPLEAFRQVLLAFERGCGFAGLKNICFVSQGRWVKGEGENLVPDSLPNPDREHLRHYHAKFRYFGREECALLKTTWGCPYDCSFCYCARLNGGKYGARTLSRIAQELKEIQQEKVFIVDDDFLVSRERVLEFHSLMVSEGIVKNFSVYGRADFICSNEELLPLLKQAGVQEIIVGLESVDDAMLESYNKKVTADMNFQAVRLLHRHGIRCCGLFIVGLDYTPKDFATLYKVVNAMELDLCMFSIFTPLKGLPEYSLYREKLRGPEGVLREKLDFLHLIVPPEKLGLTRFYFEFYKLYVLTYLDAKRLKANFFPLVTSLLSLMVSNLKERFRSLVKGNR